MKPISRPLAEMNPSYDAIVIGSGYGAGVAASRLARMKRADGSGLSVAVLERGEEIQPGAYPDTPQEAVARTQIHAGPVHKGHGGELFDLHVGEGINVLVGAGLGGTSLINANVALEADRRVFADPAWPADFASDAALEEGYRRARAMLRPVPYPGPDKAPLLNKLEAMRKAAAKIGAPLDLPPINVTFEAGPNAAGVFQPACNFCGDCCSGCNVGAKNTTLMNYLPDAVRNGTEIFCGARVRWIERHVAVVDGREETRWTVAWDPIGLGRDAFAAEPLLVSAKIVVLGAGTLGSTEILLRSRDRGLPLSTALGSRFSGNGDVLAFGYNNDQPIDGIGLGWRAAAYDWTKPDAPRPVGPTITGLIDLRAAGDGAADVGKGMVIEEGSIPGGIGGFLPGVMAAAAAAFGRDSDKGDMLSEKARELESLTRGPDHGAVNHTQTFLVMSHDGDTADGIAAHGTIGLDGDGRLKVSWPRVGEKAGFRRVEDRIREAVAATGGTYVPNPVWTPILGQGLITVHPLGGCPMGRDAGAGVVDADCRVFANIHGTDVHEGLYVCDGSVMPRSLGVNPLLTISAVAERAMLKLAEREGYTLSVDPLAPEGEHAVSAPTTGIRFTEKMAGTASPAAGGAPVPVDFVVTVIAADGEKLIADRDHEADLIGTVNMSALSGEPLTVVDGRWNLFVDASERIETRKMVYDMPLVSADGQDHYHFYGEKRIHDDRGFDLWSDTTTLFTTIRRGGRQGPIIYEGRLGIAPLDFLRQLTTMKVTGAATLGERAGMLLKFGRFFAGKLFDTFGGPFIRPDFFDPDAVRVKRPLRAGTPEVHHFETDDGKVLRLTRYRGGTKGPVLLSHGLGVSSLIFSIDTIDSSLLEYLYAGGYDVWLLDYRASIDLPYTKEPFTADDVSDRDYPAAIDKVLELTGKQNLQFVGHCYGAMTFAMAMLHGSVTTDKVRSVVISQIAAHADVPFFTQRMLAFLRAPDLMRLVGAKFLDARAVRKRNFISRFIDGFLRFLYPRHPDDRTRSITSLRISALYGPLYRLDRLNQPTLDAMPEMFGRANIAAFRQLARIARRKTVQRMDGRPLLEEANLRRWAVPTLFVHGALNGAFRPTGTVKTMAALSEANGASLYDRVEIPATGHIDCIFGKDAVYTVFPAILAHLDKTA